MKTQHKHLLQRTYLVLVFGFMYLPIAVLIAYSFNENKSRAVFTGFSLKWYASLFHNEMILSALGLSLVLAFVSAIIATVLGTLATTGGGTLLPAKDETQMPWGRWGREGRLLFLETENCVAPATTSKLEALDCWEEDRL